MLLDFYDERNRETDQLLDEQINVEQDKYDGINAYNYRITRTRTKRYRYVGMDVETAKACIAAKRALFTRTFYSWHFNGYSYSKITRGYPEQVATVTANHVGGAMWNVEIQVSERCVAYSHGEPADPGAVVDTAFNSANWRYDEDGEEEEEEE